MTSPFPYDPAAPYGRDPQSGLPYSDKSRTLVGLLQLLLPFVGICGVGRILTGHTAIGLTQLIGYLVSIVLICVFIGIVGVIGFAIWSIIDGIMMLTGSVRDARGLPLRP